MYSIKEYQKAYVEVLTVLEYLKEIDKEDYDKIPIDRIKHMEKEKDKDYCFKFDKDILIKNQVCQLSKELIAYIYFNYIASNSKRIEIQRKKTQINNEINLNNIELRPLFKEKEIKKQNNNTALIVRKKTILEIIKEKMKSIIDRFV
ncbi:MAG: hypothetical protein IKG56_03130 [Clostridia bacterium]|nr:hypothetical protein [Clostridia bacterium]